MDLTALCPPSPALSKTDKLAIVLGCVGGGTVCVALAVVVILARRRRKAARADTPPKQGQGVTFSDAVPVPVATAPSGPQLALADAPHWQPHADGVVPSPWQRHLHGSDGVGVSHTHTDPWGSGSVGGPRRVIGPGAGSGKQRRRRRHSRLRPSTASLAGSHSGLRVRPGSRASLIPSPTRHAATRDGLVSSASGSGSGSESEERDEWEERRSPTAQAGARPQASVVNIHLAQSSRGQWHAVVEGDQPPHATRIPSPTVNLMQAGPLRSQRLRHTHSERDGASLAELSLGQTGGGRHSPHAGGRGRRRNTGKRRGPARFTPQMGPSRHRDSLSLTGSVSGEEWDDVRPPTRSRDTLTLLASDFEA